MNHARDTHDLTRIGIIIVLFFILSISFGWFHILWGLWLFLALGLLSSVMLWKNLKLRTLYRSKRLALPSSLAQGIMAAEQGNIAQLADALYHRIEFENELLIQHLVVFDCLLRDLLFSYPSLYVDLKHRVDHDAQQ